MAYPQPNDPHGVIAHEIQENILNRDFNKVHLKVIYLILRLSWGCGGKAWKYSSYKDFEEIGLSKGHVKKNLIFLSDNKVIFWFKDYNILSFNKNYDEWTISKISNGGIKDMVHKSLKTVSETNNIFEHLMKSYRNGNGVTKMVTELQNKEHSYQNGNASVTKMVTKELPKRERFEAGNPVICKVIDLPKESIKESIKEEEDKEGNVIAKICKYFNENGFGLIGQSEVEDINIYIDQDGIEPMLIYIALKLAVDNGAKKWGYAKACLNDWINKGIKTVEDHKAIVNKKKSDKETDNNKNTQFGKHTEFDQRKYTDEFYESLCENSDSKTNDLDLIEL